MRQTDLFFYNTIQINLHLRNYYLRKNLDLRKIVATTDFLVHKLFDLRKIFLRPNVRFKKDFFSEMLKKIGLSLTILKQFKKKSKKKFHNDFYVFLLYKANQNH